ncbi:triadin-like [Apis mellifera carnica]|nr:triadin-like [Apis mellifera carnica]
MLRKANKGNTKETHRKGKRGILKSKGTGNEEDVPSAENENHPTHSNPSEDAEQTFEVAPEKEEIVPEKEENAAKKEEIIPERKCVKEIEVCRRKPRPVLRGCSRHCLGNKRDIACPR